LLSGIVLAALLGCGSGDDGGDADAPADAPPGRTFYVSPDGDDVAEGSETAPFGSFGHALSVLEPGDTLMVMDGEYGQAAGGEALRIDCAEGRTSCGGGPCAHGTALAPITVRAEHERRAHIRTLGMSAAIRVDECAHWVIEGLHAEHGDNPDTMDNPQVMVLNRTESVAARRLLVTKPNRYGNNHGIIGYDNVRLTIEECEVYESTRSGISISGGSFNVLRRNYVNSRDTPNLTGGYECCCLDTGDEGIVVSGEYRSIVENNVVETGCSGFAGLITSYGDFPNGPRAGDANRFLGNVALSVRTGVRAYSECDDTDPCTADRIVTDVEIVDCVAIGTETGFRGGGVERGVWRELTSIDASGTDYDITVLTTNVAMTPIASSFVLNALDVGAGNYGFDIDNQPEWATVRTNSFGNAIADFDSGQENARDHTNTDPALGGCLVYVPESSPMKGAGLDGRDIGANVVFRYENGRQTTERLWDRETGAFPCGAQIEGINDEASYPDASCATVHRRLHVGTADCPVP
jgi:parallel beta-helix repeat protein